MNEAEARDVPAVGVARPELLRAADAVVAAPEERRDALREVGDLADVVADEVGDLLRALRAAVVGLELGGVDLQPAVGDRQDALLDDAEEVGVLLEELVEYFSVKKEKGEEKKKDPTELLYFARVHVTFSKGSETYLVDDMARGIFGTTENIKIYTMLAERYHSTHLVSLQAMHPDLGELNTMPLSVKGSHVKGRAMDIFAASGSERGRVYYHAVAENNSNLRKRYPNMLKSKVQEESLKSYQFINGERMLVVDTKTNLYKAIQYKFDIGELKHCELNQYKQIVVPCQVSSAEYESGPSIVEKVIKDLDSKIICINPKLINIKATPHTEHNGWELNVLFCFIYSVHHDS